MLQRYVITTGADRTLRALISAIMPAVILREDNLSEQVKQQIRRAVLVQHKNFQAFTWDNIIKYLTPMTVDEVQEFMLPVFKAILAQQKQQEYKKTGLLTEAIMVKQMATFAYAYQQAQQEEKKFLRVGYLYNLTIDNGLDYLRLPAAREFIIHHTENWCQHHPGQPKTEQEWVAYFNQHTNRYSDLSWQVMLMRYANQHVVDRAELCLLADALKLKVYYRQASGSIWYLTSTRQQPSGSCYIDITDGGYYLESDIAERYRLLTPTSSVVQAIPIEDGQYSLSTSQPSNVVKIALGLSILALLSIPVGYIFQVNFIPASIIFSIGLSAFIFSLSYKMMRNAFQSIQHEYHIEASRSQTPHPLPPPASTYTSELAQTTTSIDSNSSSPSVPPQQNHSGFSTK